MNVRLIRLPTPSVTTGTVTEGSMTGNIIRMPKRDKNSCHWKQWFAVADLPFPHGGSYIQTWCKTFIPNLLAWAGSRDDPFGANSQVHLEVTKIWEHVFPHIQLKETNMDILIYVVCSIYQWTSSKFWFLSSLKMHLITGAAASGKLAMTLLPNFLIKILGHWIMQSFVLHLFQTLWNRCILSTNIQRRV